MKKNKGKVLAKQSKVELEGIFIQYVRNKENTNIGFNNTTENLKVLIQLFIFRIK